jgi:hypothetical protein
MMLASAGKAIQSLVTAMTLIQGKNALPTGGGSTVPGVVAGGAGAAATAKGGLSALKVLPFLKLAPLIGIGMGGNISNDINPANGKTFTQTAVDAMKKQRAAQNATTNNVTINVTKADPKATVDALSKYLKQNGSLPFNLATVGRG